MNKMVTFDKNLSSWVLDVFGFHGNDKDIIVDRDGNPALGMDDKQVKTSEFCGIVNTKRGPRLVRNNLFDLLEIADAKH